MVVGTSVGLRPGAGIAIVGGATVVAFAVGNGVLTIWK